MKLNIFTIFATLFFAFSGSSQSFNLASSQLSIADGGINVNLQTHCYTLMWNLGHNYTVNGNEIELSVCYHVSTLTMISNLNEDYFIPIENPENAVANVVLYGSSSPDVCDYSTIEYERTLDIQNHESITKQLKVFPNPTTGRFSIQSGNHQLSEVRIYDSLGRMVRTLGEAEIDISDLQQGVYYLNIKFDDDIVIQKIVMKK